jgi:GNAT superfamily N-acetyltransferase
MVHEGPVLRVLTPDDWRVWRALRLRALGTDPGAFGSRLADWQGEGDREERWRGRLAHPGSLNLVAELGGVGVGMASGIPGEDVPELISMWVAPEARGRGVGDALVAAIVAWAVDRGAVALGLAVVADNEPAVRLYVRHGFVPTGEVSGREVRLVRRW